MSRSARSTGDVESVAAPRFGSTPSRLRGECTARSACSLFLLIAGFLLVAGCRREPGGAESRPAPEHQHVAPHGGTAVVLGPETYHLELVLDPVAGALQAYLLDGHLENFIRIGGSPFEIAVRFAGREEVLQFEPVANPATGETAAETAMFEAQVLWLKTNRDFEGVIRQLNVRGTQFTNVSFRFPEGNENPAQ